MLLAMRRAPCLILCQHLRYVGGVLCLPRIDISERLALASRTLKPPGVFSTVHGGGNRRNVGRTNGRSHAVCCSMYLLSAWHITIGRCVPPVKTPSWINSNAAKASAFVLIRVCSSASANGERSKFLSEGSASNFSMAARRAATISATDCLDIPVPCLARSTVHGRQLFHLKLQRSMGRESEDS